ncbi:endonuclease/exonuclease/phosphatase family protein [Streptomyces flavofungini]|uniref:Endonuclease/exonuclease/phosphatase family protein n=1 Tax=Streptomyces flavofungini TaxID=68200 RepID=A0ABS0X887_9ACTN|nr:endonuclease/exonuclease/phosphatase family protein [Streptomyces flavofungini]MBJ3809388.1 endonuclease/exonuclease/phosphatase family protein [Streptomyces flavofungini]GHC77977.1 membrane protein [Streptomyces flavofungini]
MTSLHEQLPQRTVGVAEGPSGAADTCGGDSGEGRAGNGFNGRSDLWRRGRLIAAAALLLALVMLGHTWVPHRFGNPGGLLETFLPWLGAGVPLLLVLAAVRRSATAALAVLVPAVVWCSLFGGMVMDKRSGGGDLTVVSHNVQDRNPDPDGTARALIASGADLVALEELSPATAPEYGRVLDRSYRYHEVRGTVGLWSRYPLRAVEPVAIMPWTRALRATVATPKGPLAVYAAHLASVRVHPSGGFATATRDEAAAKLAAAVRAEPLPRVVVVGDFNGTTDDTALRPLTGQLRSTQEEAGDGFGFTWPASFPVARIDQILVKGVTAASSWTLPRTGSDHLPVAAALSL